jgi:hypothetical protein
LAAKLQRLVVARLTAAFAEAGVPTPAGLKIVRGNDIEMKATTLETQLKNLKAARKLGRDDLALRVDPAAFAAFRSEHEAAAAAAAVAAKP